MNIKDIICIVVVLALSIGLVIASVKCNNLKRKVDELTIKTEQVDSIINQHLNTIKTYELEISELKTEVDSLNIAKNKIIVKKDGVIVSNNTSSAASLLKKNLELWKD